MPLNPVQICTRCDQAESPCGGFCRCRQSGKDLLHHQAHVYCPLARYGAGTDAKPADWDSTPPAANAAPTTPPVARPPAAVPRSEPYWKLWESLHTRPRDGWDGSDDIIWLYLFVTRIPCGDCRREYLAWLRDRRPDFSSPASYFAGTVEFHNRVNAKLGKRQWTLDEAQRLWGF